MRIIAIEFKKESARKKWSLTTLENYNIQLVFTPSASRKQSHLYP
jgi:hypothetical protein